MSNTNELELMRVRQPHRPSREALARRQQAPEARPARLERGLLALLRAHPGRMGSGAVTALQRMLGNALLQRLAEDREAEAPAGVAQMLESERGHGQSLGDETRAPLERAFGASFESVRVHADSTAEGLSHALQARAFTAGSDIYFDQGEYQPATSSGQRTLAHELAHVVQQGGGLRTKLVVGAAQDPAEREADAVAERVLTRVRQEGQRAPSQALRRQATPEEEEEPAQALRRQESPEEEEVQAIRG